MNYRMTSYLLGMILTIESALLLLPTAIASLFGEDVTPFLYTILIVLAAAIPLTLLRPKNTRINAREGFVVVALAWILMSLFGALPYVFSGTIPHYVDAVFETISGFTTTGSTILTAIEGKPMSILFWRSFTHWVGGMGVLMLMLAILPMDPRSIHLMRAEVPGPTKGKLVPQLKSTAKILYAIYIALTLAEFIALLCTGLGWFDSLINAFATAGTGGFARLNNSIGGYHNAAAEWVIAVFMLLFGVNFNLYHLILIRRAKTAFKNEELRVYLLLCAVAVGIITANTIHLYSTFGETVRTAFFQVAALISTTGFSTTNHNDWPMLSKAILLLLTLVGACAGSTAGGLKLGRVMLLLKSARREFKHLLHPQSMNVVRMDKTPVAEETVKAANHYIIIFFTAFIVSMLLVSLDGAYGVEETFTGVLTCISNVGPGLGQIGPAGNFAGFSWFSKLVLSFDMLLGRLELIPMLILFSPSTWTKK